MALVDETGQGKATSAPRVVLVDDHPLWREALRRLLIANGTVDVTSEFTKAEDALERIAVLSPDLVVMDVRLPGMDGIQATREIKHRHPNVKVVILSAFGTEYVMSALAAGADGYLVKTGSPTELVHNIVKVLNGEAPIDPAVTRHVVSRISSGFSNPSQPALSSRQTTILQQVANGATSKDIASLLFVSEATVKREIRAIFEALSVNDRAHAVAEAYRHNLI